MILAFQTSQTQITWQMKSFHGVDLVINSTNKSTCYIENQVIEHVMDEVSNQETTSGESDHVYMVGRTYPLSNRHWLQATDYGFKKKSPSKQYNPEDETIAKSYSETYDENCNIHDGSPMCSPYNDDSPEGLLPCDLFSEEDEYENEDKYRIGA